MSWSKLKGIVTRSKSDHGVFVIFIYNGNSQSYNLRCLALVLNTELGHSSDWPGISYDCITLHDANAMYLKADQKKNVIFSNWNRSNTALNLHLTVYNLKCLTFTLPLPFLCFPLYMDRELGKKKKKNTCSSIHSDLISAKFEVTAKNIEVKLSNQFLQSSSHWK